MNYVGAVRLLAIAMLAGALLAGCGNDDSAARDKYVRAVNAAQDRFHRSFVRAQSALDGPTASATQERRALVRLRQAVGRAVGDLRAAAPPKDLAGPHRRLVAALEAYGPVIAARRAASSSRKPRELLSASTSFAAGSAVVNTRVQRAIDTINAKL
jgi:hypothetical protein